MLSVTVKYTLLEDIMQSDGKRTSKFRLAYFSATTESKLHLKGSVKEPNISIYFFLFSAHHSAVFYF